MARVCLRKLVKRYGATEVVRALDLGIAHNEFVALVGPSGCGKSTTLSMIAGLEGISDGEVLIDDRVVMNSRRRTVISRWCSRTTRYIRT